MEKGNRLIDFAVRHWRLLAVIFALIVLVTTLSRYSVLTVEISSGTASGDISYKLLNQGNLRTIDITTASTKITRIVPKGTYEVLATQNGKHSFMLTKTKGFFQKSSVSIGLEGERSREFVGDNPSECMFYSADVLYSYGCGFNALVTTHIPATANQATHVTKSDTPMGVIRGAITTKEGVVIIGQQPTPVAGSPSPFVAYVLGTGLSSKTSQPLTDLDAARRFSFTPYKDGFLAYDTTFEKIYYYSSVASKPETINISRPADNKQKPVSLSAKGEAIVVAYSDEVVVEEQSESDIINLPKVNSQVFVFTNNQTKQFNLKKQIVDVQLCGTDKLCVLGLYGNQPLSVYDIGRDSANLIYGISGVRALHRTPTNLLAIRDNEVVGLDVDNWKGSKQYDFRGFEYCGVTSAGNDYVLCLIDGEDRYFALRINQTSENTNNIDRKIFELKKLPEIVALSIYRNNIYISAYFGAFDTYNPELDSYGPNPANVKQVSGRIIQKIDELGIDREAYNIGGLSP